MREILKTVMDFFTFCIDGLRRFFNHDLYVMIAETVRDWFDVSLPELNSKFVALWGVFLHWMAVKKVFIEWKKRRSLKKFNTNMISQLSVTSTINSKRLEKKKKE